MSKTQKTGSYYRPAPVTGIPPWVRAEARARNIPFGTVYDRYKRMLERGEPIDKEQLFKPKAKLQVFMGLTWNQWSEAILKEYGIKMSPISVRIFCLRYKDRPNQWNLERLLDHCKHHRDRN